VQNLKKLIFLLSPKELKRGSLLILMITVMALLDTIGVASILPFVAVLTNISLVETNIILNNMFKTSHVFGVETKQEFLFLLGMLVFLLLIISLIFKAITIYVQIRFVRMCEHNISKSLVEVYLKQPYSWFLSRNSSELGKNILSETSQIIANGIQPLTDVFVKSIVIIAILALLVAVDPKLAFIAGISIGSTYLIIFIFVVKLLERIGGDRLENNKLRFKSVSEAIGAIKEIKIKGIEKHYLKIFSNSSIIFTKTQSLFQIISQLPRYFFEAIAFGGILLIILYTMAKTSSLNNSLPIISLYIFAGYRLMPAFQQLYTGLNKLVYIGPSIDKIYEDLNSLKLQNTSHKQEVIKFEKEICLNNISYNYPNTSRIALQNINLNIPAKSTVGFVGPTGCGKTTIIDVILGLLEPKNGTLEIDDKVINQSNIMVWQRIIGYVPQYIYLFDDTIASNIAFETDSKNIDQNMVEKVSKIANLHKFVFEELPNRYDTIIGERGARLSGGQRQRIGIARALYHNPKVLILDEATSALDNETEKAVMEAINNLNKDLTIIIIAHRLNTLKNCDCIFMLDKGKLKNKGNYANLIKT